jgi:hypothetical protein
MRSIHDHRRLVALVAVGVVLENVPKLERSLGRAWAGMITLVLLVIARKQSGPWSIVARTAFVAVSAAAYLVPALAVIERPVRFPDEGGLALFRVIGVMESVINRRYDDRL